MTLSPHNKNFYKSKGRSLLGNSRTAVFMRTVQDSNWRSSREETFFGLPAWLHLPLLTTCTSSAENSAVDSPTGRTPLSSSRDAGDSRESGLKDVLQPPGGGKSATSHEQNIISASPPSCFALCPSPPRQTRHNMADSSCEGLKPSF